MTVRTVESTERAGVEAPLGVGLSLLLGGLYIVFLNPHLDLKAFNAHDPVMYLLTAQALWRGEGYGMSLAEGFVPVKLQPPGFSVLLAPVVGFCGMNFFALKLFMVGLAGLMAWACHAFFRHFLLSNAQARAATLLLMASPIIFQLSHQILAEIPLLLCTALALVSCDRYLRSPTRLCSPTLIAAAGSTVAACFLKGLGLGIMLGAWLLLFVPALRTRKVVGKLLLFSGLTILPLILWQMRLISLTPPTSMKRVETPL